MNDPIFLIVDLFCGFGGTTTGFADAVLNGSSIAKVIACVNHDPKAIKSHWLNHSDVKHFEEDIRTLDLTELTKIVKYWQAIYPNAYLILWASLECTNFSKAKGGQARDADSRTLAEHLFRYQQALSPDYIQIENVVEFMSWGPLDEKGKPVSRKNGQDWMKWKNEMCSFGYYDQWKELNSADFGAFTSRNRLFGCFAKHGLPIAWPETTHAKKPGVNGMFGLQKKWKAVKHVLNFNDEGESIFNRKKPLSDKTLERIYAGLIKYIARGDKAFIAQRNTGMPSEGNQDLVQPQFLASYYSGGGQISSIENPCPVLPTKDRVSLLTPVCLINYNHSSSINDIDDTGPTILGDRLALLQSEYFIDQQYGASKPANIEQAAGSLTINPKLALVEVRPFIFNPSHGGHTTSTDAPCPVIIARQDKAPLYLVQIEQGAVQIAVYDYDSAIAIKIKEFMVIFSLVDIKMRMLRVAELLRIQGFPDDYQMVGNQSDQKKFIGNSVHPLVPKHWAEALAGRLIDLLKAA